MSKYTTGEIAALCGISVRTVQYYDTRSILVPSELSEGGRRLYSDEDVNRLKVICFLREAGFSINDIAAILDQEHPEPMLTFLLNEREQALRKDLEDCRARLHLIDGIRRGLRTIDPVSAESIGDIARTMKQKNKLTKLRLLLALIALPIGILQAASIILWITHGLWWLFVLWLCLAVPVCVWVTALYYKHTAFICPSCHTVIRPPFREVFFAYHTPTMRRLTCPHCGYKGLCVEVYADKDDFHEPR